jgi:hypothetical protein
MNIKTVETDGRWEITSDDFNGSMSIRITRMTEVYVQFSKLTSRGREYKGRAHLKDYGTGLELRRETEENPTSTWYSFNAERQEALLGKGPPTRTRGLLVETVLEVANCFRKENTPAFKAVEDAWYLDRLVASRQAVKEAETTLKAAREEYKIAFAEYEKQLRSGPR